MVPIFRNPDIRFLCVLLFSAFLLGYKEGATITVLIMDDEE